MLPLTAAALWGAILVTPALAHSHIAYVIINGRMFRGYDAKAPPDRSAAANPASQVVAWSAHNPDDGFISPDNYTSPDMICHRDGMPSLAHAPVRAGDRIRIQWNGWPQSHVGPALSHLARCTTNSDGNDSTSPNTAATGCTGVNKTDLRFFTIDDSAPVLLDGAAAPFAPFPGRWVSDVLIAQNNSWQIQIPPGLAPGPYVLRQELIALHYAAKPNGAQNYPQCINLWVTGPSSSPPNGGVARQQSTWGPGAVGYGEGVSPTAMYKRDDPGVLIDVTQPLSTYKIPGPPLVSGAAPVPPAAQTVVSLPTAWGTPVRVIGHSTTVPLPVTERFVARPTPS